MLLAHLRREPNPLVKVGDVIKAGQWVGYIGNSGNTSEPHLHIHVVTDATEGDPSFPLSGVGVLFTINNKKMTRGKSD